MEDIADKTEDALNSLIKNETEEERQKYIDRLPELYRTVARKRLIDGMKYNEIAENLGLELNQRASLMSCEKMMRRIRYDEF